MGRLWKTACLKIKVSESREFPSNEATKENNGAVSHSPRFDAKGDYSPNDTMESPQFAIAGNIRNGRDFSNLY